MVTAISIGMSAHSQLGAGYNTKYAQRSDSSALSFQHETSKAKCSHVTLIFSR